jgi:PKD repeat protein
MKFWLYTFIVVLALACLSCQKKKYPESIVENSPVFYFKATINNTPVDFYAGMGGYQMYSACTKDTNNVYSLTGTIRKNDCSENCPSSVEIRVNDYAPSPASVPVNINLALAPKYYDLQVPGQFVQFLSSFNKPAGTYYWDFGDGTSSTLVNPGHVYGNAGTHHVCLTVRDNNKCVSTICNEIKTGRSDKNCMAAISALAGDSGVTFSPVITGGVGPFQYLWAFGDGTFSTSSNVIHKYLYTGSYPASLRVIDLRNDTSVARYNVVTKSDVSSCAANFKISAINNDQASASPFSNVVITWVDETGTVYKSNSNLQSSGNYFQVLSVEEYDANENGEPTRKAHIKFKCDVFNGLKKITIDNAEAIITVAYK